VSWRGATSKVAQRAIRWDAHAGAHTPALRGALSFGCPLVVLAATGRFELAAFAAFGAFTANYGRRLTPSERVSQQSLIGGLLTLSVATGLSSAYISRSPWTVLLVALGVTATTAYLGEVVSWRPAGPMFFMFAAGAAASMPPHGVVHAVQAIGTAAASAAFAVGVSAIPLLGRVRSIRLRATIRNSPRSPSVGGVADPVLAAAIAGVTAILFGVHHMYWAPITALAAFSVSGTTERVARSVLRLTGTVVGLGFAAIALSLGLRSWGLIILIVGLQVLVELTVLRNYAVALAFITPLALLVSTIGIGAFDVRRLMTDRLLATGLGILAAITVLTARHLRTVGHLDRLGRTPTAAPSASSPGYTATGEVR
jgi:hypothetical protein